MTLLLRIKHAWAVLIGINPPAQNKDLVMPLAEDILALFPKFQAAVAAKDQQIATLTAQVDDLTTQVANAEQAVTTVSNELDPPAPAEPAPTPAPIN